MKRFRKCNPTLYRFSGFAKVFNNVNWTILFDLLCDLILTLDIEESFTIV